MRYASIDAGTNTFRLLIAEADGRGNLKPLLYKRAITRLGGSYTEEGGINKASAERAIRVLEGFSREIARSGVKDVHATATSVVRRAVNRPWFLDEVLRRTGIRLSVITGDEEARLSLIGVLSVLKDAPHMRLIMDIGGGSTEFIAAEGAALAGAWSMEMGVVHLTERHLKSDPLKGPEISGMEAEIKGVMGELKARMERDGADPEDFSAGRGTVLAGTAGTITTLAAIDLDLRAYDAGKVNNYALTKKRVAEIYRHLAGLTLKEREGILSLEKGREDLIVAGAAITLLSMDAFGFDSIKVSDAGLLEGIIIDRASRAGKEG